jgi:hypothetical protein
MSKWLKEPLIHFLLLGGLIFILYGLFSEKGRAHDEILISTGQQNNLVNTFARTWQRPPTPDEFKALLDDYVRQEIAYREGQAMGLDRDDIIIRRRMRQKLELLAEDVASLSVPSDEQLQEFMEQHAEDFILDPVISLRHIYFSPDRRGTDTRRDAEQVLSEIAGQAPEGEPRLLGDPLPLPFDIRQMRESEIARTFGRVFTDGLDGLHTGQWSGPVESGFGLHLVYMQDYQPGRMPGLDEVRAQVQRDWFNQYRQAAVDGMYQRLAENYDIEIQAADDDGAEPEQ